MARWKGWLAIFGGVLVHLSLGTVYTFGNMTAYLTSYLRHHEHPADLRYHDTVWIFSLSSAGQGLSMFLGGILDKRFGPRITSLAGGWIMSIGVLISFFAVKQSFALTVITYGFLFGLGLGIAYVPPLACVMKWFPNRKGLVNGMVLAGFGGGAFIFNFVQTAFINPDNKSPDQALEPGSDEKYFTDTSVLDRVPTCFILLGVVYAAMQLIGSVLLFSPPETKKPVEKESLIASENSVESDAEQDVKSSMSVRECTSHEYEDSKHPFEMLKTRAFWTLWLMFLVNGQGMVFISTLYKPYGQTFIKDDQFLAVVGSFAAVFNAGGRILWGHFADKTSFRLAMLTNCTAMIALMMTLVITSHVGRAMFFIWVCLIFGTFCGNFSLFPTATAKTFGPHYVAVNYGLVFTSQIVTGPLGAILSSQLSDALGWFGLFSLVSGFVFIGLILAFSFNAKNHNGKDV